jgi:hypothetical protein
MPEFLSSSLANFVGSLLAGTILAVAIYCFVTRRLEIIQPRQERIEEEIMVCNLLIGELERAREFAAGYLRGPRPKERLHMHAWDALKGSRAMRLLPVRCLDSLLKAYGLLYELEYLFLKVEEAQMDAWAAGDESATSGLTLLGKKLSEGVRNRLALSQRNCEEAKRSMRAERDRLVAISRPRKKA